MSFFNAGNKIYLTCDASDCNYLPSDLFSFVGQLDLESLQSLYFECDVLLFPSGDESYGLPLIEAMKLGLPIIAPSLPYVHTLCSSYPYYFSDSDPSSFIDTLDFFCRSNPPVVIDYSSMLEDVPSSWSQVCLILLDKYNI